MKNYAVATVITVEDVMEQMEVGPSNRNVVESFLQKEGSLIESEMRETAEEFITRYFPEFWEQFHENQRDAEADHKLHAQRNGD